LEIGKKEIRKKHSLFVNNRGTFLVLMVIRAIQQILSLLTSREFIVRFPQRRLAHHHHLAWITKNYRTINIELSGSGSTTLVANVPIAVDDLHAISIPTLLDP
jgi:hypothetical protein